jgi:hypothetical protein
MQADMQNEWLIKHRLKACLEKPELFLFLLNFRISLFLLVRNY